MDGIQVKYNKGHVEIEVEEFMEWRAFTTLLREKLMFNNIEFPTKDEITKYQLDYLKFYRGLAGKPFISPQDETEFKQALLEVERFLLEASMTE